MGSKSTGRGAQGKDSRGGKGRDQGAGQPLDSTDRRILRIVDDLHRELDPPPADLDDRINRALEDGR